MNLASQYLNGALALAGRAAETQLSAIEDAAASICGTLQAGGSLWVFGTGHSHTLVEEVWGRAGGIEAVRPILEPSLMLHEGLAKSSLLERQSGLADVLLKLHPVSAGDTVVVISNSGRNAVPVEMAQGSKDCGATVVALTSMTHSSNVPSRAPSGRRLFEVADIVIDNCGVSGDALIPTDQSAVGPTSTVIGALLIQALMVAVVDRMARAGRPLGVLGSLNV